MLKQFGGHKCGDGKNHSPIGPQIVTGEGFRTWIYISCAAFGSRRFDCSPNSSSVLQCGGINETRTGIIDHSCAMGKIGNNTEIDPVAKSATLIVESSDLKSRDIWRFDSTFD